MAVLPFFITQHPCGYGTTEGTVFDVEPFGHEFDSSELIEVKDEWLRRIEIFSVFLKRS